ncbi:Secreted protein, containing von Willebrand factor (VWF) type A domain [hydrothermal vent metagenome]|uniref:Secreted protein, containing von Willebrand factor (VWF) type A domain n=1 Tax=hydrothermal vent metagenome TaxID=652676 RepID=A0A3B0YYJ9_9ZZZZ
MSRRQRRSIDIFNLSFLDVVSCGFGAIILLLVIVKISEPRVIEQLAVDLTGLVQRLQAELYRLQGEAVAVNQDLRSGEEQLSEKRQNLTRLRSDLSYVRGQFTAGKRELDAQLRIEVQLETARQSLSEELRQLLGDNYRRSDNVIGGIPVDSDYIIFIIDTSGSMQKGAWPRVKQKLREVLAVYPQVKGIQVMNDMGDYLFSQYKGRWIKDTPARRKAILKRLSSWQPFSNSSPVEGIEAAIKRFYAKDKRISLYVFGDDFARGSIQQVVTTVDRLNRADASGQRRVRIHALGFPVLFSHGGIPVNSVRFAALMRKLAEDNNGSFVGLGK